MPSGPRPHKGHRHFAIEQYNKVCGPAKDARPGRLYEISAMKFGGGVHVSMLLIFSTFALLSSPRLRICRPSELC